MSLLANTMAGQGHYVEAENLIRDTIKMQRRILGLEHPDTLVWMSVLALKLLTEDRFA